MNQQSTVETLRALSGKSNNLFVRYSRNLQADKDPKGLDPVMHSYLSEVVTDPNWLDDQLAYLQSIGWKQNKYEYNQLVSAANKFQSPDVPSFEWNKHFQRAKADLINDVKSWHLLPIEYGVTHTFEEVLPRKESHAGWTYIETCLKTKGENLREVESNYDNYITDAIHNGSMSRKVMIGTRTSASDPYEEDGTPNYKYKPKTRFVSMIDMYLIFAELVFAKRMQTKLATLPWYAGGKNDADLGYLIWKWRIKYRYWLSIDYKSFDQTIPAWLIRASFDIVRDAYSEHKWDEKLFRVIREDFINKEFVVSETESYFSRKGIPSGSMFTQIIGTIANNLMIRSYLYSRGVDEFEMIAMSDDNLIFSQVSIDAKELKTYLEHNFGVEIHVDDKLSEGESRFKDPSFLSRQWRRDGVWRDPHVLVAKLLFPERYRNYDRDDFEPSMVVESYLSAYPLPMRSILSERHRRNMQNDLTRLGDGRYLSGLDRYRAIYGIN